MISVICGIRNRTENLMKVLPTWLDADGVGEVVITDWNSREAFVYEHEKVSIIRVTNVDYWSLPQAFNLAARFSKGDIYAKLDADYKILNPSFFTNVGLEEGTFINGRAGRDKKGAPIRLDAGYLNGFFYLYRDDFWKIHGFDERMHGYGWDDCDLARRLQKISIKMKGCHMEGCIKHLPHEEQDDKSMHAINAHIGYHDPWNPSMPLLGVDDMVQENANTISCMIYRDPKYEDLLYTRKSDHGTKDDPFDDNSEWPSWTL